MLNNAPIMDTLEVHSPPADADRDAWVQMHVNHFRQTFQQWQQPSGIDSDGYAEYLEKVLAEYWQDPLLKTLIEMI